MGAVIFGEPSFGVPLHLELGRDTLEGLPRDFIESPKKEMWKTKKCISQHEVTQRNATPDRTTWAGPMQDAKKTITFYSSFDSFA